MHYIMAPIIYNIRNAVTRDKMAAFDYDWTLVNPKGGRTFPVSIDDWEWLYPHVPAKIRKYYNDGYMIVIFTNQSRAWKCDQIRFVADLLGIPLFVVIAMDKVEYKPNRVLFDALGCKVCEDSFFVGDALGRKTDFSDSDKLFAEAIGIDYYSPEEFFKVERGTMEIADIPLMEEPEIVIMMGYPGSGKSTIAKDMCRNERYIHIEGDVYKTSSKMIKASIQYILDKKSIVFDATNSSIKKRKEYIDLAAKYDYKVRCIHVTTSADISYKRNKERPEDRQVPKIAYSVYTKYFEEPDENEGFELIIA